MLAVSVTQLTASCETEQRRQSGVVFVLFLLESSTDAPVPVFLAKPSVLFFNDYSVGHVFEVCFSDLPEPL